MALNPRIKKNQVTFGFDDIRKFLKGVTKKADTVVRRMNVEILNAAEDQLKSRIEGQNFNHPPLTQAYLEHKAAQNLDPRILMATKFYFDKIGVYKSRNRDAKGKFAKSDVFLGVPDQIHVPSGVDLKVLAIWLEAGTPNMPPRPHYAPIEKWVNNRVNILLRAAGFQVTFRGRRL